MSVDRLRAQYRALCESADPLDTVFEFKAALLAADDDPTLEFHYGLLRRRDPQSLYVMIRSFFDARRDKRRVADLLFAKYRDGIKDGLLKADVIQILGHLRSAYAKTVALENINAAKGDLRYRSIIVLGWVGGVADLAILNERLRRDRDPQLRGYAASAMRQIWYNHPKAKTSIVAHLAYAIAIEENDVALSSMIVVAQELLKKKFGMKESKYGDLSGDPINAKAKLLAALR